MDGPTAGVVIAAILGAAATIVTALMQYSPKSKSQHENESVQTTLQGQLGDICDQLRNIYGRLSAIETRAAVSETQSEHWREVVRHLAETVGRVERELRESLKERESRDERDRKHREGH